VLYRTFGTNTSTLTTTPPLVPWGPPLVPWGWWSWHPGTTPRVPKGVRKVLGLVLKVLGLVRCKVLGMILGALGAVRKVLGMAPRLH